MFEAPATSDKPSKTHGTNLKCAFSELLWSIFAVGRLEHAIVLWNCWCVNCVHLPISLGRSSLSISHWQDEGFRSCQTLSVPISTKHVFAGKFMRTSIDIFTWYFNFGWDSVRDRLKNVKSLSGGGNAEGVFVSDVTTSSARRGGNCARSCDWLSAILGRVTEAVVMHALPTRDLSVSSNFINFPWRTKAKFPPTSFL